MSWTTQDLREVMTDRSLNPPVAMDRAAAAERMGRRQRVAQVAVAAVMTVAVLAVTGVASSLWLREQAASRHPQPANPTQDALLPENRCSWALRCVSHGTVDGLHITTAGPSYVPDSPSLNAQHVFSVRVTISNSAASPWIGQIGVGLYLAQRDVSGIFVGPNQVYLFPPGRHSSHPQNGFVLQLPDGQRIEGVVEPVPITVPVGATRSFSIRMTKGPFANPAGLPRGWLPVLDPRQPALARFPDPLDYKFIG